ncbi:MAG: DUF3419 family protein [Minisyncoccia bacterium]|jgi:S-adenosylmethionine-diacylglycerol 3-amino-3-carboxypropyl transferase
MDKQIINYSNCWEDSDVLTKALNINSGDDILSITSGGCNTLALLLQNPRSIVAVDFNSAQNYLLELKVASFRILSYDECLAFFGITKSDERLQIFDRLKNGITHEARQWWMKNTDLINKGIINVGKFEHYLSIFRTKIMPLIHSKKTIRNLFLSDSLANQKKFYDEIWNTWLWRFAFRIFFSRMIMDRFGRRKGSFAHTQIDNVANHYFERARHGLIEISIQNNYLINYIFTGTFNRNNMPPYLQRNNYNTLKTRLGRLKIVTAGINEFLQTSKDNAFSKFNLSDIFETMNQDEADSVFEEIVRVGRNNSIFAFWNNLVDRKPPDTLKASVFENREISNKLFSVDRGFMYSDFLVYFINKDIEKPQYAL